ncbi:hypothetical protein ACTXT7_003226 [Hymenolepis weldensis]
MVLCGELEVPRGLTTSSTTASLVTVFRLQEGYTLNATLDRKTAMTSTSTSTSRAPAVGPPEQSHPRLTIFKDVPEETANCRLVM